MTSATTGISKAVIMARGLGTRMRRTDPATALTEEQAKAAASGVKGMIPVGRPFIEYLLSALADAGFREVCLITGPEHESVRMHYRGISSKRIGIHHAIQQEPRGTADAVLAASDFAGQDQFLVLNSDNYYPIDSLCAMRSLEGPGLAAFSVKSLVEDGGIPEERARTFPIVITDQMGFLSHLGEGDSATGYASMNCWRFGPAIFEACRSIPLSPRGELELPAAVQYSIDRLGERYRVIRFDLGVLDISSRADIAGVASKLKDLSVSL